MKSLLSRKTADKIKALLGRGRDANAGRTHGGGTSRYDVHVIITGPEDGDGFYPCHTTQFNTEAGWETFTATCLCTPLNRTDYLSPGRRYRAMSYGMIDDVLVLVADPAELPPLGCHLGFFPAITDSSDSGTDGPPLVVGLDVYTLAGCGLEVDDDSDELTCDPLKVKAGCHIECDDMGVHVTPDTLAGGGLTTQAEDDCDTLAVNPGCGLLIDEDGKVAVDLEDIAGAGLHADNDACTHAAKLDCGLEFVGNAITIDYESLAGKGLQVTEDDGSDGDGCPQLEVKAGCGIAVNEDGVRVHASELTGCGLKVADTSAEGCEIEVDAEAIAGCGLKANGCKLDIDTAPYTTETLSVITGISASGCGISYTTSTYGLSKNSCGIFLGFGLLFSETSSFSIKGACCDCSDDSSSSSSSSSSGGGCDGSWYCIDGVCVCVADEEEEQFMALFASSEVSISDDGGGGGFSTWEECQANCGGDGSGDNSDDIEPSDPKTSEIKFSLAPQTQPPLDLEF